MKKILSLVTFFAVFTGVNAQNENKIDVARLIKITETSDFPALVKLVRSLSYVVIDSSKEDGGSLIYISREDKINGNVLGCTIDSKNRINHLSFSTRDIGAYETLKKQIKGLGFKSSGLNKGRFPEIVETEDFEKGKILIGTASKKKEDSKMEYEFIFLQW
jgi:hypothetical protein